MAKRKKEITNTVSVVVMIITFYSSSLVIIIIIIFISLTEQQLKSTLVHTTLVYMRSLHHSHHHTRDMSSTTNNNRRPNEVFRQQEGGNVDGASDASLFTVIVRRNTRVLILTSRTVYYRRRIPEGGFLTDDILHMENLLGIRFERLVDLLERRSGLDGIVNPEVTFWVMMYETTNRLPPRFIIRHRQQANNAVAATPQLLHQVVPSPDDTCVICLETGGGKPTVSGVVDCRGMRRAPLPHSLHSALGNFLPDVPRAVGCCCCYH